ncbi:putative P-loop containing nucleoside triphosphate hydrolases superfamily protein [Tripterygium wilfordii]|uniref:Putative P-loop containing nucleoside triphosphate hydrolases superfamily protein n=1 Tax=Tripterygium wilfordii TaxID=458696 RepID=A0A7J7CBQ4_TRIWF|nr:AAA-ATPase At2g46620-like [Tripterygium wilfordii]KAF5731297.1 putative P-loop containing nucleoside triphosphate hydrolases superfamily protein [Tripterygium wilfordii]
MAPAIALAFAMLVLFMILRFLSTTSSLSILGRLWRSFEDLFHVHQLYRVPQTDHEHLQQNQLYRKVSTYLNSLPSHHEDADVTNLFTGPKPNDIILRFDPEKHSIPDTFLGAKMSWTHVERTFVLKLRKKDKRRVLRPYLQHILSVAEENELSNREIRMYMNFPAVEGMHGRWRWVQFNHPATFDTVVMDGDVKNKVKSDLESFLKSKQYYNKLGRVWKRSYLLYGASGTGKSSFIAAMAKFLCFDVYDVDLSRVSDDADLKMLLLETTARSVIVIEGLDRFLTEKSTTVSLSGILNFMDGIISCCGKERVMVFTMNSKDQIDQAVMRPGRIDVHIHFPPCDFSAFKGLANSYLGVKEHKLFSQVEEMIQYGSSLSPAEIGEIMISNRSSPSRAIKYVITALQANRKIGQRLSEDGSGHGVENKGDREPGSLFDRENSVKDFRKLYGLLRMGSKRKDEPYDLGSIDKQ